MERIIQFLEANSPFFFATTDGTQAYVRPFGLVLEHEGRIYFSMGTYKESFKQLQTHPDFEVCTADHSGHWLRVRGKGVIDEDPVLQTLAFEKSPELRNLYNETTGHKLGFIYLKDGVAEFCDMSGGYECIHVNA